MKINPLKEKLYASKDFTEDEKWFIACLITVYGMLKSLDPEHTIDLLDSDNK